MKKILSSFYQSWFGFVMLALALGFAPASCSWVKPATDSKDAKVYKPEDISDIQGKKVFDPETGTWRTVREVNGKVDTLRWKELSADRYPPITSDGSWTGVTNPGANNPEINNPPSSGNTSKTFNVALILPFMATSSTNNIDPNSLWGINFYAGAKLAYEGLQTTESRFNLSILDTEGSATKTGNLLRSADLQKTDLIIGPYKRENVALAADFAKQSKKPMAVPYNAQMAMVENTPWYIQVNPSLKSHCKSIVKHIRQSYPAEDVVLIARNKDGEKDRLVYFHDANAEIDGRSTGPKFKEMIVTDETSDFRKMDVSPYIRQGRTTVFVVPSWSNETFVYSLLRQLMIKKSEGDDIVVYGMPQWMGFEQIDYDFFEKLKVHVSSSFYLNDRDERIRQFKRKYFDTYGSAPTEESYLGYDIMLYFGKMLDKWGRDFYTRIDAEPFDVLHTRFEFQRVVLDPQKHREQLNYSDQLENTFVHILRFLDYRFQPAD